MRISDWSSDVCSSDLEALHAGGAAVLQLLLLDRAARDLRHVVGRGPGLRGVLHPEVVSAGLEGLERDRGVAVVLVMHGIEVEEADPRRMVLRPIVLDALVGDRAVRLEGLDAVGAAAPRRLQERLSEIAGRSEERSVGKGWAVV